MFRFLLQKDYKNIEINKEIVESVWGIALRLRR